MENDPALEHALLEHLRFAPLTRAELARRTGVNERRVQAALNDLITGTFVARRPQDSGPADYELTAAGSGRLDFMHELQGSPLKVMAKVFGAIVVQVIWPSKRSVAPVPGTSPPNWGTLAFILLPVVVLIAVIVGNVASSGASAVTVVIFLLLVAAKWAWTYRGSRLRR